MTRGRPSGRPPPNTQTSRRVPGRSPSKGCRPRRRRASLPPDSVSGRSGNRAQSEPAGILSHRVPRRAPASAPRTPQRRRRSADQRPRATLEEPVIRRPTCGECVAFAPWKSGWSRPHQQICARPKCIPRNPEGSSAVATSLGLEIWPLQYVTPPCRLLGRTRQRLAGRSRTGVDAQDVIVDGAETPPIGSSALRGLRTYHTTVELRAARTPNDDVECLF